MFVQLYHKIETFNFHTNQDVVTILQNSYIYIYI